MFKIGKAKNGLYETQFKMMLAGLELDLAEMLNSGKAASLSGTLGVIVPLILGFGTAMAFGLNQTEALFMGLALSATSSGRS